MDNGCRKENQNIYFKCRKEASLHDRRLSSRESAADLLGVSVSSLADYESGNIKVMPAHIVDIMANLYNAPQLRSMYCKNECPFGNCTFIDSVETVREIFNCFNQMSTLVDKLQCLHNENGYAKIKPDTK